LILCILRCCVSVPQAKSAAGVPLASLSAEQVGCLLANFGFTQFAEAFTSAEVTGKVLEALESAEDIKDLGIAMPPIKFKAFAKSLNDVSGFVYILYIFCCEWYCQSKPSNNEIIIFGTQVTAP